MVQPPYLRKGDKIAIVSPARKITFEEVFPAMKLFEKWGFEVVLGTHVFGTNHQFSGTDEQRLQDLQQMLDDPTIRAVISGRGGYGTVRIIDKLDFTKFSQHPKWIIGYSDVTVLHSHIHRNFGIQTLHATMPVNMKESDTESVSIESLRKSLTGEKISYTKHITFHDRTGLTEGLLVGGNLSILNSLMESPSDIVTEGKILLLEDVDEYLYHVDRMMINLKRAGKLKHLKGLIVGGMTDMKDNEVPFGKNAEEIIVEAVSEYHYPVCFDFPAGHGKENVSLFLGRQAKLIVDEEVSLLFH
ncbi:MAG: LD-carboxypeptidase [Bacteroidales bacterium]|nr:LD-carboxypeptidase [Bacteroidota bacterium]MBL6949168.1 LD-carboxypeptidase [Bacteroidales bacterium]